MTRRRLAAILAVDMVGYSRLMAADDAGTLARLKTLRREIIDPEIARHGGQIVKLTGDGLLATFESVTAAVEAAAAVQEAVAAAEAATPPERRAAFRIGINLGEIILDEGDVYGDGVNIAARLEAEAAPGGIAVTDIVRDQVQGRVGLELSGGEEVALKNIDRPVRVWRWCPDAAAAPGPQATAPDRAPGHWRPTLAVLPFDNLSGDPDQDYFADGLAEDLITALTHWASILVVARNSSFTYRGRAVSVPQAARELGADYVVEGSVRRAGNRVRVSAQLIDGTSGHHVWAERYDRDLEDIFEVQDELVHRIASALTPELGRAEMARAAHKRPKDREAWDHWLRGEAALGHDTPEGQAEARKHFERAVALDPDYADAHAGIAMSYNHVVRMGADVDRDAVLDQALAAARRAVEADFGSARAHYALSTAYILREEHDPALAEAHLAVELNPNDPKVVHALGNKSDLAGDPEGIGRMEFAQQLNPRDPVAHSAKCFLARAYINARDYPAAIAAARAAIVKRPGYGPAHFILAIALAHDGRLDEAAQALRRCEEVAPDLLAQRAHWQPYTDPASNAHLLEGLHRAMEAAGMTPAPPGST